MKAVYILPFEIDAYDEVLALWQRCEGVGLSTADTRENIDSYLKRNPGLSFVALINGQIVGAILCGHDGRRGYIHHLAVHPNCRRQGVARQLVDHGLTALSAAGIQKCHLFIFNDNSEGILFWKSVGWIYRSDIHVMSKTIEGQT
ncbi:MAG: GNAT family N-acetyltransferase [Ardenticatenaceae bacterium]|nr:GNAT family N-acetyltransferase [Ardenticatenaceae bacterium]